MRGGGRQGLIIAIDGPSGAGKSTITKLLADRLGYVHIDTGAMFRAVALAVKRAGLDGTDDDSLQRLCRGIEIHFLRNNGCCRVVTNGEDVTEAIRTPEISALTSAISARKVVRDFLLTLQRSMGNEGGVILEGRDIGTVVFPDADVKFFLSASVEERGRRRWLELKGKGEDVSLEETVKAVAIRDEQDSGREHAPLRRADDAIDIDSTGLSIDEVITRMEGAVRERERLVGMARS
ncbi:(d)CMP kinase [Geobacter sp.]|uniref:(d)CMP kinase n=1 Tax=Geobacter sp. TaxID=46610 RepID=UPI0027B8A2F4|nr:(d)CMP kinase [Geobacter sp.]